MSLLGPGVLQIILVLGVSGGIGGSRGPRGAVVAIKENDYFQAAQAIGLPVWKTLPAASALKPPPWGAALGPSRPFAYLAGSRCRPASTCSAWLVSLARSSTAVRLP